MKTCPMCGMNLDDSMFGRNAKSNDGLQSRCRSCRSKNEASRTNENLEEKRRQRDYARMLSVAKEDTAEIYMPGKGTILVSLPPMTA